MAGPVDTQGLGCFSVLLLAGQGARQSLGEGRGLVGGFVGQGTGHIVGGVGAGFTGDALTVGLGLVGPFCGGQGARHGLGRGGGHGIRQSSGFAIDEKQKHEHAIHLMQRWRLLISIN